MRRMTMKKAFVFIVFACLLPLSAAAQNALTLDAALSNSTSYFSGRIQAKTKVVVLNFSSKWPDLSDYIIEELIGYIVNEGKLTVVDRQNLETIRKEMDFQLSGEVSDETAQSIGKKLGAQTIMSGSITAIGNSYRLRIRAIAVETAEILGMQNVDVAQDSRIAALTGTAYTGPAVVAAAPAPRTPSGVTNVTITPANANYIELRNAGLGTSSDDKSTGRFSVNMENIEGIEREVLVANLNLASGHSRWVDVFAKDMSVLQKLMRASGVRFKVIGDGKGWYLNFFTKETSADSAWYYGAINTQKDKIVVIDIPYSRLRQPANWGKKAVFNKNSIFGISFSRNSESPGGAGASTIKIFDLEIY
jgi:TolB-like protein